MTHHRGEESSYHTGNTSRHRAGNSLAGKEMIQSHCKEITQSPSDNRRRHHVLKKMIDNKSVITPSST